MNSLKVNIDYGSMVIERLGSYCNTRYDKIKFLIYIIKKGLYYNHGIALKNFENSICLSDIEKAVIQQIKDKCASKREEKIMDINISSDLLSNGRYDEYLLKGGSIRMIPDEALSIDMFIVSCASDLCNLKYVPTDIFESVAIGILDYIGIDFVNNKNRILTK